MNYEPVADDLIRDLSALRRTLRRMQMHNSSLTFWNKGRTLKLLLHHEQDFDDENEIEVYLKIEEDEETEDKIIFDCNWEPSLSWDRTVYTIDEFTVHLDNTEQQDPGLKSLARAINRAHRYKKCGCGEYIVMDEERMCLYCEMTSSGETHFCPICHEEGPARHMQAQKCCGQYLHKDCLATWIIKSPGGNTCPLCRNSDE
jgi:hypothetical protein